MIYYDKKGYENLRDSVFWLEDLGKKTVIRSFIAKGVLCLAAFCIIGWCLLLYYRFLTGQ
tara:strand:- start:113 stop:292 length:180 start_codon:yes stop_codon:yes gene_type:complete